MAVNVVDLGADNTGTADATSAFQAALDQAGTSGETVLAPAGTYKIAGSLQVPSFVTLEGEWRAPAYWAQGVPDIGTVLHAYAGRGNVDGPPFITLAGHAAGVKGLAIRYPFQGERLAREHARPAGVQPYPPTIRGGVPTPNDDFFDNLSVQDCLLVNPYSAVDFATHRCGRHFIRGLYGQPLRAGIQVDGCLDVGRIEDVHFWPFWRDTPEMKAYTGREGFAIVLRRSDWQIVHNVVLLGYHVGILFGHGLHLTTPEEDPTRARNLSNGCNGQFSNVNIDVGDVGLDIYNTSGAGISFANLSVACTNNFDHTIRRAIWAHPLDPSERGRDDYQISALNIVNGSFWGGSNQIILWERGGPLQVSNSLFRNWERGEPAIRVAGGRALISGNTFLFDGGDDMKAGPRTAVEVGPAAEGAIIMGNDLHGLPLDVQLSTVVAHNLP